MSDKKYSVFISSTFDDLKDERMAVLRAILQHGHFPLGMELWGAADEQQWQIIQRQIDVADYYVVIVAHRYGSSVDDLSWTEREYDYAVEKGVPVLGFVIGKDAIWLPEHVDKGIDAKRLAKFKAKVQSKPVSFWRTKDDLCTSLVLALSRQMQSIPRVGWVRGSDAMSSATANELARLSEENGRLRRQVDELVGHQFPNVGFELERVSASGSWDDPHSRYRQFGLSITLRLSATLRRGVPVGFKQRTALLELQIGDNEPISIENYFASGNGASITQLDISGPITFGVHASGKVASMPEDTAKLPARLILTMIPIGYESSYRVIIPLKQPAYSGDRENWNLDDEAAVEQKVVPTPKSTPKK